VQFQVLQRAEETAARLGELWTDHGAIRTPVFMPVGTRGTVKSLTPEDLYALGAEIVLANAYHLWLRPGTEVVKAQGGLHRFMHWERPLLTDSGGYQVFSLAQGSQLLEEGVTFRSHLDGSRHFLTPEKAIEIQEALAADIIICLDECIPSPASDEYTREAAARTVRWARRCQEAKTRTDQALFPVVQGGNSPKLRKWCADQLVELDFPGYAVGGLSVGEPREAMLAAAGAVLPHLPGGRPRYGGPGGSGGTWSGHVRLRPADPERPHRPALHQARPNRHQEQPASGEGLAHRRRVCLLHVPALFPGLLASSFSQQGASGVSPQYDS
jgi:queuine tRNA-ribosyltransferase